MPLCADNETLVKPKALFISEKRIVPLAGQKIAISGPPVPQHEPTAL